MPFIKFTAPALPPRPHIRITTGNIQFTVDGQAKLAEIAPKVAAASHVYLWSDPDLNAIAITPADKADRDSFSIKGHKISARAFLEQSGIDTTPLEAGRVVLLEPYDDGVQFSFGPKNASQAPTPVVKRKRRRRDKVTGELIDIDGD